MDNKNSAESQQALIIVAGAFNFIGETAGIKELPVLLPFGKVMLKFAQAAYATANRAVYNSISSVSDDSQIVVPEFFGVFDLEGTYEQVEQEMLGKIALYPEETDIFTIGFSLGGLFVPRFTSRYPNLVKGSLSIVGPHRGSRLPFFGEKYFHGFHEQTADLLQGNGPDGPPIHQAGSRFDELVPLKSSLADLPHVKKDKRKVVGGLNHVFTAFNRDTIAACRDLVEPISA